MLYSNNKKPYGYHFGTSNEKDDSDVRGQDTQPALHRLPPENAITVSDPRRTLFAGLQR
jgi:hypothetical protein